MKSSLMVYMSEIAPELLSIPPSYSSSSLLMKVYIKGNRGYIMVPTFRRAHYKTLEGTGISISSTRMYIYRSLFRAISH